MKTHFPVEFMAALLTLEMSNTDKVAEYLEECKGMGIEIVPPDINSSELEFAVSRDVAHPTGDSRVIHFGLGAIKGVGAKAVRAVTTERADAGRYRGLFDLCERVDLSLVNRAAIEALICAGAFDRTGAMRKSLADSLDGAISAGQSAQHDKRIGQMGLFVDDRAAEETQRLVDHGGAEWPEAEMLAREKAVLGFYITKHPLAASAQLLDACASACTAELSQRKDGDTVVMGGMVSSVRTLTPKNGRNSGKRMGIVTFEDLHGRIEAVVFPDVLERYRAALAPDKVVFLEGSVDRKREQPSLCVSRVVTAGDAASAFANSLILDVDNATPIDELAQLLRNNRGTCNVYLNVTSPQNLVAQVECHPSLRTTCGGALLAELQRMLGRKAVCVLGPRKKIIPLDLIVPQSEPQGPPDRLNEPLLAAR